MEIQQLRKEFNQLLDKINQQSERFTGKAHLPSLEVSVMISKINKLQEVVSVLKYATEAMEDQANQKRKNYDAQLNEDKIEAVEVETKKVESDEVIEEQESIETITSENDQDTEFEEQVVEEEKTELGSVGDKFLQTPISSLQDAFSLNDRYLFANELFNKDMSLFNGTLKMIDDCDSIEEAVVIVKEKVKELNWDMESEYFLLFQNKVERRFLS